MYTVAYIYIHTGIIYIYIYVYMYLYIYVCICIYDVLYSSPSSLYSEDSQIRPQGELSRRGRVSYPIAVKQSQPGAGFPTGPLGSL